MKICAIYANRSTRRDKEMIGMFVSAVPARIRIDPETGLLAFLKRVAFEQYRHQRYPYNQLVQDLHAVSSTKDTYRLFDISIQNRT
ncbi:condensation domain-containing protein [Paenibacillus sp. S33]